MSSLFKNQDLFSYREHSTWCTYGFILTHVITLAGLICFLRALYLLSSWLWQPLKVSKKKSIGGICAPLFCCSYWEMTHSFYLQRVSRARWKWAPNRKSDYSFQISVNAFIFLFYVYPPDKQFCGWIVYILQTVPAVCYLQLCSLWSLVLPCCYSLAGRWNHCQENGNQQKNASP